MAGRAAVYRELSDELTAVIAEANIGTRTTGGLGIEAALWAIAAELADLNQAREAELERQEMLADARAHRRHHDY